MRMVRLTELKRLTGLGADTIWALIAAGRFPNPCCNLAKGDRWQGWLWRGSDITKVLMK